MHTQAGRVEFYRVAKRITEKSVAIRRLETKYKARGHKFTCTPDNKFADSTTVKGTLRAMKNECCIKAKVAPLYLAKTPPTDRVPPSELPTPPRFKLDISYDVPCKYIHITSEDSQQYYLLDIADTE